LVESLRDGFLPGAVVTSQIRAIYFLMVSDDLAVLIFAYSKSTQEDLTQEQRKAALALFKEMTDGR
jgi:hypothetical protein